MYAWWCFVYISIKSIIVINVICYILKYLLALNTYLDPFKVSGSVLKRRGALLRAGLRQENVNSVPAAASFKGLAANKLIKLLQNNISSYLKNCEKVRK